MSETEIIEIDSVDPEILDYASHGWTARKIGSHGQIQEENHSTELGQEEAEESALLG